MRRNLLARKLSLKAPLRRHMRVKASQPWRLFVVHKLVAKLLFLMNYSRVTFDLQNMSNLEASN